jgi:hypothetical protein
VVDPLAEFKDALDRVPLVLLGAGDERVLNDARTSIAVLEGLGASPASVVLAGSTGVGKSHLLNDLAGTQVSAVGVIRPTTTSAIIAGRSAPVAVGGASKYVHVPGMPDGLVVVDTPGWGSGNTLVLDALATADVGVLVVSPTRYADRATQELWSAVRSLPATIVVLNRQRGTPTEQDDVLTSVRKHFDCDDLVVVDESGPSTRLLETITEMASSSSSADDGAMIARITAAQAGRYVAGAATSSAMALGQVASVVESVTRPDFSEISFAVRESWRATQQEFVAALGRTIDGVDATIVDSVDDALAGRMLSAMPDWRSSEVESALVEWQADVAARFRSGARIRWRRASTEQALEQTSWEVGVNPTAQVSRRARRVMGRNLEKATLHAHERLVSIADDAVESRIEVWRSAIAEAGSFKPGELLAAADALGGR